MTKFATSQEWLEQASLLLKAYPTTTKITTKYNLPHPSKTPTSQRIRKADEPRPATLEVRAYDPDSGVVLKFSTNKQQEVGRLIASLGRLGRSMAALPEKDITVEDTAMLEEQPDRIGTPTVPESVVKDVKAEGKGGQGGAGGGGKKKKKGKK